MLRGVARETQGRRATAQSATRLAEDAEAPAAGHTHTPRCSSTTSRSFPFLLLKLDEETSLTVDPSAIAEAFWNYDYTKIFDAPISQDQAPLYPEARSRKRVNSDGAERQRHRRQNETEQERAARLEANAACQRRKRLSEAGEQKAMRLESEAIRREQQRRSEDEEKRLARLEANAQRTRWKREHETAEERAARLAANAIRQRQRRLKETSEERAARLAANAQRQQRLRLKAVSSVPENVFL
ncbi:hypothetical protein Q1695_014898 [Nippostrongylus brasiliensis]|nr:hypothetical protein Q1695_014898 [Nippostrongylus brasiliensis]